jgi:hypothetical protein
VDRALGAPLHGEVIHRLLLPVGERLSSTSSGPPSRGTTGTAQGRPRLLYWRKNWRVMTCTLPDTGGYAPTQPSENQLF